MLDDHDREVGAPGDRILHAKHDDGRVDDDQLQRQLGYESSLLAGFDEQSYHLGRGGVRKQRELVHTAGFVRAGDRQPLNVVLRRLGIRRLREDEDLVLDGLLKLVEPRVDRAGIAQYLYVLERIAVLLAGPIGRRQLVGDT